MSENEVPCGIYQHYKVGDFYEVIGSARHSETCEEMVIYIALYNCKIYGRNQVWVRPKAMFIENVVHEEYMGPRFKLIQEKNRVSHSLLF